MEQCFIFYEMNQKTLAESKMLPRNDGKEIIIGYQITFASNNARQNDFEKCRT
jgi:hypothetical protein